MASFKTTSIPCPIKIPANHGVPCSHLHVLEAGTKASLPEWQFYWLIYKNTCPIASMNGMFTSIYHTNQPNKNKLRTYILHGSCVELK